jgi:hypothetical protein
LITRKNDHHWVSTDSKKSNCHYLCAGEIQSGEGDVNTRRRFDASFFAGRKKKQRC